MVTLEQLVPKDHLLRKIDAVIDYSFIHDRVAGLYCTDSGCKVRDGKPKGLFYLDHRTVNGRHAIITDTHVTPANVHDSIVYLKRLDRHSTRFAFDVSAVSLLAYPDRAVVAAESQSCANIDGSSTALTTDPVRRSTTGGIIWPWSNANLAGTVRNSVRGPVSSVEEPLAEDDGELCLFAPLPRRALPLLDRIAENQI